MSRRRHHNDSRLWLTAVIGSLLFNVLLSLGVAVVFLKEGRLSLPKSEKRTVSPDMLKIVREKDKDRKPDDKLAAADKSNDPEEEKKDPSFLKTSEEQEAKEAPKDPVFIGERNTRLASEREANPDGLENLPSVNGQKKRNDSDFSLIEQKGQMGELEHENPAKPGSHGATVVVQTPPQRVTPVPPVPVPQIQPRPQDPIQAPRNVDSVLADNQSEGREQRDQKNVEKNLPQKDQKVAIKEGDGKDKDGEPVKEAPDTDKLAEKTPETQQDRQSNKERKLDNKVDPHVLAEAKMSKNLRDIMKTAEKFNLPDPRSPLPAAPRVASSSSSARPVVPQPVVPRKQTYYDPVFEGGRPGYKPTERKTRISGRMSSSGAVAADVKATPLGAYQAMFLRTLNRNWDKECLARRDFIIPGSLKIRFLLHKNGTVSGIRLLNKEGASEIQKGFTFKAIKDTSIPAMNEAVLKELGEEVTELVIDFYF